MDALAYHRACLAAELERARDAVSRGAVENADLSARLEALKAHVRAQREHVAALGAARDGMEKKEGGGDGGVPAAAA